MKTTRNIAILAISAILFSCGGSQTTEQQNKCIAPLPAGVSVDSLKDCTVPASFTNNDFNWMGGNLSMTVYNTDLYDAVEVSQMQVGDTIIYAGEPIIISQIDQTEGGVEINGGQVDEGGCCRRRDLHHKRYERPCQLLRIRQSTSAFGRELCANRLRREPHRSKRHHQHKPKALHRKPERRQERLQPTKHPSDHRKRRNHPNQPPLDPITTGTIPDFDIISTKIAINKKFRRNFLCVAQGERSEPWVSGS